MKRKTYTSEFNKVVQHPDLPKSVKVFDTTLRDGEQTPGVSFMHDEKIQIAEQLDKLGVNVIEAGFPINSAQEKQVVKEIAEMGLISDVCGLSRVVKGDIDVCMDCNVDIVHIFISTSDIHIKHQMGTTREKVKEKIVAAVSYIKDQRVKCLFSPMDATRTNKDYLIEICKIVEETGADMINIPDTIGVMNPPAMRYLISEIKKAVEIPLDVHCHNDFGLAVPNTLAAVEAGASQVQVTVNGLGERAGNADMEQTIMGLEVLYGVKTGINTEYLTEASKIVEQFSDIKLPPNFPIVGRNAFTHESGIHADAVLKKACTFESITPEMVGQKSRIVLGKHTGSHAVKNALKSLDYGVSDEQLGEITRRIKDLANTYKKIPEDSLVKITEEVINGPNNN